MSENTATTELADFTPSSTVEHDAVEGEPARRAPDHLERSVGVGVVWKLVGQAGVQGIRLVTVAVLARLLTPADYGAAAIAIALGSFAPSVADMGMGAALVQTDRATRVVRSTVFWASLAFGVGLLGRSRLVSAGPIGRFLGDPRVGTIVAVGGLTFVICSLGVDESGRVHARDEVPQHRASLLVRARYRELRSRSSQRRAALAPGHSCSSRSPCWLHSPLRCGGAPAGGRPSSSRRSVFRELGSFAVRVAGGRWARLAELLVLSLLIGKLARCPRARRLELRDEHGDPAPYRDRDPDRGGPLLGILAPCVTTGQRMAALWLESNRFLAAVILPVLVGLIVVAPDLIPTVFGPHWHVSVGIIQILSIYVIIRSLQSWSSVLLDAVGRPQVTLWTQLVALCLTPARRRHRLAVEHRGSRGLLRRRPADRRRDPDPPAGALRAASLTEDPREAALGGRRRDVRHGDGLPSWDARRSRRWT